MIYEKDTLAELANSIGEIRDVVFNNDTIILTPSNNGLKFINCIFDIHTKVFMENEQVTKDTLHKITERSEYNPGNYILGSCVIMKFRVDNTIKIYFNGNTTNCPIENVTHIIMDKKYYPFNLARISPHQIQQGNELIVYKAVQNAIVTLRIPADAKRCNNGIKHYDKSRCEKALVIRVERMPNGEEVIECVHGLYTHKMTYKVGEWAIPDSFDEDCRNECSHGIHFYMDKNEAIKYYDQYH